MRRAWRVSLLACALSCLAAPAHAEGEASADQHFRAGVERFDHSDFSRALAEFRAAYAAAPNFRVLYNIGRAAQQLRDHALAYNTFRRYLAEGAAAIEPDRRAAVEIELAKLESFVARLRIRVTGAPPLSVSIDDMDVGVVPLAEAVAVNAGDRMVVIKRGGAVVAKRSVSTAGGDTLEVTFDVPGSASTEPVGTPPPPPAITTPPTNSPSNTRRTVGFVLLGGGAAILAGAAATDLFFLGPKFDDFEAERRRNDPHAAKTKSTIETMQTATIVGYAIGGAAAALGTALVLWPRRGAAEGSPKAAAVVSFSPFGVATRVSF